MATFNETVETIASEEASVRTLFNSREDGNRVRENRQRNPQYMRQLVEAADFVGEIDAGRRPLYHLREAMSTDDFPLLFADILDRQLLAAYRETPAVWRNFVRRSVVPDFRTVKRFAVDGAEAVLPEVAEGEEYPEESLSESEDSYSVRKYGRRLDLFWEALVNDDLDAFRRSPERLARAARRSEQRFATELYVDANGPHASLYTSGNSNIVTGNPVLSTEALQTAFEVLADQTDEDGEPIVIEAVELVVPPALEVTAQNILNAMQIEVSNQGGTSNQTVIAANWMRGRTRLNVDPYIPLVASSANGATSWFLFANPDSGRPALELGFLRGFEDPALYERMPNARRVGGGEAMEAFEDDSVAWRVRHVFGGTRLTSTGGEKSTVASNGSGA